MKPESLRMRKWRDARKKKCPDCDVLISYDSERCTKCSHKHRGHVSKETITIGEWRRKLSLNGKHPSWVHAQVRTMARYYNQHLATNGCMNCGYSKHTEMCHIIPIAEWSDEALVSEVNASENILCLCRNCHWELDHGMLTVDDIKRPIVQQDRALVS